MNTLNITIANSLYNDPIVLVDDQKVKFKRNEFGSYVCSYKTEKEKVDIKMYKYLELNSPLWYLLGMFYFFISIFGIFDLKPDKRCIKIVYHSTITLKENSSVRLSFKKGDENPIETATECEHEVLENIGEVDQEVKKRLKILRISKIVCWLLLIASGIIATVAQL